MVGLTLIQKLVVYAPPALLAITLHEVAHGYAARHFGDRTAEMLGRLTLNPLKHIDPVGTILVPAAFILMQAGMMFGWAKPVPVATRNLRNPRKAMMWVAAAGPGANMAMAIAWALVLKLTRVIDPGFATEPLVLMSIFGIQFNAVLAVLNLVPIPPLDGGRVLSGLLSPRWSTRLDAIEPYGFMIIILLLVTRVLWIVIGPAVNLIMSLAMTVAGLGS